MAKDFRIEIRVTAQERDALKASAKAAGTSLPEWIISQCTVQTDIPSVRTEKAAVRTKKILHKTKPINQEMESAIKRSFHREPRGGYGFLLKG